MMTALIALALVWLAPQDAFVAQRETAAALNPLSPRFTIALAGERRAFRPGEAISVLLSYDDIDGEDPQHFDRLSQWSAIKVFVDPQDGVAWPSDFERSLITEPPGICCGVRGGVVGGGGIIGYRWDGTQAVPVLAPPLPKPPPVTGILVLNQLVRFDAAGHYRIYLTDGHSSEIAYSMGQPEPSPLVSNILDLEIGARDAAWEDQAASGAVAVLASSSDAKARTAAARTLRFLGTDRAIDEMVRALTRMPDEVKSREDGSEYERGLFAAPNRARAIDRLEAVVDDPAQPAGLLLTLAALQLTASEPEGLLSAAHKRAAYNALASRRQRILQRAGTLVEGLAATFEDYAPAREGINKPARRGMRAPLSPSLAGFPREVEIALRRQPPSTRRAVLERERGNFLDPRFVPMLTRFADASVAGGPADAAVDILNDIAPTAANRIIRADLARARPRLGAATIRLLPEPALPAFDRIFLAQLTAARGFTESSRALDRIARYATAAIAPQVQQEYLRQRTRRACELAVPALSYFFRTDQAFARKEMHRVWNGRGPRHSECRSGWLSSIAAAGMSSGLEQAGIDALADPDADLAADAARMLAGQGSVRAESALWSALEAWHARWTSRPAKLRAALSTGGSRDAALGDRLQLALRAALAWRLDDRDYTRMIALCLTPDCKEDIERWQQDVLTPNISYDFYPMPGERRLYRVDHVAVPVNRLRAKLDQYPAGTTFQWSGFSPWLTREWFDDFDAPFRRVESLLPAGMRLSRN